MKRALTKKEKERKAKKKGKSRGTIEKTNERKNRRVRTIRSFDRRISRYDDESMSDYWQRVFTYKIPIRVFSSVIYVGSKLRNADATTSWKSRKPRAKLILQQPYP